MTAQFDKRKDSVNMGQEQSDPEGRGPNTIGLTDGEGSPHGHRPDERVVAPQYSNSEPEIRHDSGLPKGLKLPHKRHATNSSDVFGGSAKVLKASSNTRHNFVRADHVESLPPENGRKRGRSYSTTSGTYLSGTSFRNLSPDSTRSRFPVNQREQYLASPLSPRDSISTSGNPDSNHTPNNAAPRVEYNGIKNVPTGPSCKKSQEPRDIARLQHQPHIFMPASCLPVLETQIVKHLMGFFRNLRPLTISMDGHGWYLFFEDSPSGRDRLERCYENYTGQTFFSKYTLTMYRFPDGQQDLEPGLFDGHYRALDHPAARLPGSGMDKPLARRVTADRQWTNLNDTGDTTQEPVLLESSFNSTVPTQAQRPTTKDSSSESTNAMDISSIETHNFAAFRTSVRSDRDETSSVFSGTTHSDGTKSKARQCYVCKNDAAYRAGGLIKCSTCSKRYHRSCTRGVPVSATLSPIHSWRCSSCIKKDGATADTTASSSHSSAMPSATGAHMAKSASKERPSEPLTKPIEDSVRVAAVRSNPAATSHTEFNTNLANEVTPRPSTSTITMEVDPPRDIEASADPEADDLVAQSFAANPIGATNASTAPKTGKLKLTRTKLKPGLMKIANTPGEVMANHSSRIAPERLQNSDSPATSTLPNTPLSSATSLQQKAFPTIYTAADLRELARNKMLKIEPEIEKDPVGKCIIRAVSTETTTPDAVKLRTEDRENLPAQETVNAAADASEETARTEDIGPVSIPLSDASASSETADKPLIAETEQPAVLQQPTSIANIASTRDRRPEIEKSPLKDTGTAAEVQPSEHNTMQPTERRPPAKAKMARRGGVKSFTLLPCSVCKTKISFPISASTDPICSSCKEKNDGQQTSQGKTLRTDANEDVVMQNAPALDNQALHTAQHNAPTHTNSSMSTLKVHKAVETQAAPAGPRDARTISHDGGDGSSFAEADDDETLKRGGLQRRSCDKCYKNHTKCTHHTRPPQTRRKSCEHCFTAHVKCIHQSEPVSNLPSVEPDPGPPSLTAEEIAGDTNVPDQDFDVDISASKAAQTPETSFTSVTTTSKTKITKPKRKGTRVQVANSNAVSPTTLAMFSGWTDEKLSQMKTEIGDSFERPLGTRMKLVGMAFRSLAENRLQTVSILRWVSANLPMYKHKEGNWENMLSAQMSQGKTKGSVRGFWRMVEWKEGDGGIGTGAWYELFPDRKDELWQWDAVLKEPVSPQHSPQQAKPSGIKAKKLRGQTSNGSMTPVQDLSADSSPVSTPSSKISRKTASIHGGGIDHLKAASRRASRLSTPLLPEDAMDVDEGPIENPAPSLGAARQIPVSENQRGGDLDNADSSSNDEPMADTPNNEVSGLHRSAPTTTRLPSPGTVAPAPQATYCMDEKTTQSLAQLLKLEALNLDYSAPSLFDEWPEQHPDNMFNDEAKRAAKQAEIRKRPTRKQLFGKPALHSRIRPFEPPVMDESPVKRAFLSPEKRSRAIVDARPDDPYEWEKPSFDPTRKKFTSLEHFFDMPDDPIPIMSEGHLAFRDGTRNDYGRLPRAKAVFKAGYDA